MALCLAESLIACEGNNPTDQLERYTRWYREGHLSSTGRCFNIGHTVRKALSIFEQSRDPYSGPSDTRSAGNGSIMRLAPVHLFYARRPLDAIRHSGESSRTTHGNRAAVDACRYFGGLLAGVVNGQLAGACYGIGDIPERWLERLALRPLIERFAEKIYRLNRKSTCEKRIVRG